MATRKDQNRDTPEIQRTKQEWIESAASLKAERFEVAGALFDVNDKETVTEAEIMRRLTKYRGGDKS